MRLLDNDNAQQALSEPYDVIVVGSGVAGLSAALFAAMQEAKVLLVESTPLVGGTTATCAGTAWVPGTHHNAKLNPSDSIANAALYLNHAVGDRAPARLREAFLAQGALAIALLEQHTQVRFRPYAKHPDYISQLPGSTLNGRAIEPEPFDGRLLGQAFALLRPPIPEFTVLGGMMVDRSDINHLLALRKSWKSFRYSLNILARHAMDRLRYPRGTRLVMGNAFVARFLASLQARANVSLSINTALAELLHDDAGRICGAVLLRDGKRFQVAASKAVVLASGGFNRHPTLRAIRLPAVPSEWCPAAPGHEGVAQDAAVRLGARFDACGRTQAFWAPVSKRVRSDGTTAVFPHFVMDRAKPGMVTVNAKGERFVNESTSYHLFALAMQESGSVPAYLICDALALKAYGLGMVRPGGSSLEPFLADGYLTQSHSLEGLAQKLGIDSAGLTRTVAAMNNYATQGKDPEFGRGETAYAQNIGDATAGYTNPNLGPMTTAPFYAVTLFPGDIGACAGLAIDEFGRVLHQLGEPLPGLYALGNDAQSIMGDVYPAPGITLGPGLVFGHIVASHICANPAQSQRAQPVGVLV